MSMDTEDSDMEASMIQQFSCMGTQDKEVLISQLQKLVGPQLNNNAAQFFLDMNNWNLQLAVGAYFDLTDDPNGGSPSAAVGASGPSDWTSTSGTINGTTQQYSMSLLSNLSAPEGDFSVPPSTKFMKTWKIKNIGTASWPPGSHLRFKTGHRMCYQEKLFVSPPLHAGEVRDISVEFTSPAAFDTYEMRWQMATPEGYLFGEEIWVIVTVAPDLTTDLTQQLQSLSTCDANTLNATRPQNQIMLHSNSNNPSSSHLPLNILNNVSMSTSTTPFSFSEYPSPLNHLSSSSMSQPMPMSSRNDNNDPNMSSDQGGSVDASGNFIHLNSLQLNAPLNTRSTSPMSEPQQSQQQQQQTNDNSMMS